MKRALAIVLIGLGALVLLSSVGYYLFERALLEPGAEELPDRVAGMPLGVELSGARAVSEINRLHGKDFPLTSGAVGVYGDEGQITIWVSGATVGPMAERILIDMREKIAEGNSPFIPTDERSVDSRTIYELDGLGQQHVYYRAGNLIIWLAADGDLYEEALSDTLSFYP